MTPQAPLHLKRFEADRWFETHGALPTTFDRIVEVSVPDAASAPAVAPLAVGESRLLALMAPPPDGNAIFAEHRADGRFVVVIEAPRSSDDRSRVRREQASMGVYPSLPELLRGPGARLGTPPHWADDDLAPYFPHHRNPDLRER